MKRPTTFLATTVARLVFPFLLLLSLHLMLVGHNRPGGGFIAGVMVVAAVALQYVTFALVFVVGICRPVAGVGTALLAFIGEDRP